jgi:two-component system response regulator AtoC
VIRITNLPPSTARVSSSSAADSDSGGGSLKARAEAAEAAAIRAALAQTGGSRKEAAKLLGVSVRTLFYKLRDLGIGDG